MRKYIPKEEKVEKLPCEKCILLAACKNKETIHCKELYLFLCNVNEHSYLQFTGYKEGNGIPVTRLFKKYITATLYDGHRVSLVKQVPQRSHLQRLYQLQGGKIWTL